MSVVMVISSSSCSRLANAPLFPTYPDGVGGVGPLPDIVRVGDDPLPCPSADVLADVG